jgi:hypothetical protein
MSNYLAGSFFGSLHHYISGDLWAIEILMSFPKILDSAISMHHQAYKSLNIFIYMCVEYILTCSWWESSILFVILTLTSRKLIFALLQI